MSTGVMPEIVWSHGSERLNMSKYIQKIKKHIEDHKIVYSCAVTTVVVAGITCLIMRESHAKLLGGMDWPEKAPVDSLFISGRSMFGSTTNVVTTIHKGTKGNSGFVTRCIETGELFETQSAAARAFGIPEQFLSSHLNNGRELSENLHFERIGVLAA